MTTRGCAPDSMCVHRCIHCGGYSQWCFWAEGNTLKEEFYQNHGPGKCVEKCQYCREGVPHAAYTCASPDAGIRVPLDR